MSHHAVFAPSAASRWIACPGSIAASEPFPDSSSDFAREGSFAHAVAAWAIEINLTAPECHGLTSKNVDPAGTEPEIVGFTVGDDDIEPLGVYLDYIRSLELLATEVLVEQRVRLSDDIYGTADALLVCGSTLHVVDLKWGRGVAVNADDNAQLKIYALAALETHEDFDVDRVVVHIVQPRVAGSGISSFEVSVDDLDQWYLGEVHAAVIDAKKPDAPRHAGAHCRFCPAAGVCPEKRDQALAIAQTTFGDLDASPPAPMDMDPQLLARILTGLPDLEAWIKSVRGHASNISESGVVIPGFKTVAKVGNRQWRDDAVAQRMLAGYDVDPFAPRKLISPSVADKCLGKKMKSTVASYTERPVRGTALVPDSDRRPAISPAFTSLD